MINFYEYIKAPITGECNEILIQLSNYESRFEPFKGKSLAVFLEALEEETKEMKDIYIDNPMELHALLDVLIDYLEIKLIGRLNPAYAEHYLESEEEFSLLAELDMYAKRPNESYVFNSIEKSYVTNLRVLKCMGKDFKYLFSPFADDFYQYTYKRCVEERW